MNLTEWAENEVNIVKSDPNTDRYSASCVDSALKAFKCLMEDGHSGLSISVTKNILNRLIDGKPLTPITEKDFEDARSDPDYAWLRGNGLKSSIQCPRMPSLFRKETIDGKVMYHDNSRIICRELGKDSGSFYSGICADVVDEMFPITLPYVGNDLYTVYVIEYLFDEKNGDFDTIEVVYIKNPNGEQVPVGRYFTEKDNKLKEISKEEFAELKRESKNILNS